MGLVREIDMRRAGVGFGINGDALIAELLERADGAGGDFAAIGDEDVSMS